MFNFLMPLFNAEGEIGGSTPQASEQTQQIPATPSTPAWGMPAGSVANAANPLSTQPPAQTEYLDFAGRKVPVVDPVLKDVYKDYTNLNSTYTKTNQELAEMRGRAQALEQMVQQLQSQPQAQPQAPQGPSAEDLELAKENFMNKFYDDPMNAILEMVNQGVAPVIEPITKEREYQQQVQSLQAKHSDFQEVVPYMEQLLSSQPQVAGFGLETVYWMAKGQRPSASPAPTMDQLLTDPSFVEQILQNPNIKQRVQAAYLQDKQAINTPVVMANHAGGVATSIPEAKPKTMRESSKLAMSYFNRPKG